MSESLLILLLIVFVILIGMIWWSNEIQSKILKRLKECEQLPVDERYYELKYRIQSLTFSAALVFTIVGLLGYTSFMDVKVSVMEELNREKRNYESILDSLFLEKVDTSSTLVKKLLNKSIEQLNSTNIALSESNEALSQSNESMQKAEDMFKENIELIKKQGKYNVIRFLKLTDLKRDKIRITFKSIGIDGISSIPPVFISPTSNFDIRILEITKEYFDISIRNATSDTVGVSVLIFIK